MNRFDERRNKNDAAEDPEESLGKRWLWFAGLWLAGFAVLLLISLFIRWGLGL